MNTLRFRNTTMKLIVCILTIIPLLIFSSGCHKDIPTGPVNHLGSNTIAKYVAIGNSLTAGYQSAALYESAQCYSFPNLIAHQIMEAGGSIGSFEQPLWGDPGTGGRMELISMNGPMIQPNPATGVPKNTALARPYDNLGVPGAVVFDFLDTTDFTVKAQLRNNFMFPYILRSAAFGKSILAQARSLNPDLVTFWLGNNDVLGYATSGGVSPGSPTPRIFFSALYRAALDSLRAALPNAKIVVANIPNVTAIPFFTTIGQKVAASLPSGVYLRYQKHGNTGVAFDSTRCSEANAPLLTLAGSTYASLVGQPGGKWYRDKNYPALPAGIDTTKPFGVHPQNPWPDALTLDADEQAIAATAISDFNAVIAAAASANSAALVDINTFFNNVKANGFYSCGQRFTTDYITGGLFSLDGVHPSSRGAGVMANEFIKVINATWGMSLAMVHVSGIPAIPCPPGKIPADAIASIPVEAFRDLELLWGGKE
ncbi:MAG: hypothetical protein KF749_07570 [Bacteroidetes bacterium]|nr:hypothetical protein [Bacteroidota bacterium]MCW5896844.1 hypothetical protein [Bacteroidota bacterium]